MAILETLSLLPSARVEAAAGAVKIETRRGRLALQRPGAGATAALDVLAGGGGSAAELAAVAAALNGVEGLAELCNLLESLSREGLLCRTLHQNGVPLASFVPVAPPNGMSPTPSGDVAAGYVLSRFALLRRDGGHMTLESPLSTVRVVLHGEPALSLVGRLAAPCCLETEGPPVTGLAREAGMALLRGFVEAGLAVPEGSESGDPARVAWEFHDLLFHSRSRMGRHDLPYGAVDAAVNAEPEAIFRPAAGCEVVQLAPVDLPRAAAADPPFTAVLEGRRSLRADGAGLISRDRLGEFLYRAAGARPLRAMDSPETARRAYPGAGGRYELEIYPLVERCDGLARGLYRYVPAAHELHLLSSPTNEMERMLEFARGAAGQGTPPQVLLVVTARFVRLSSRYRSLAYALVLKDVGVLLQTMYLVGTAMGLSTCALGGGDSELFARASGLDYLVEGAVGEFLLAGTPGA